MTQLRNILAIDAVDWHELWKSTDFSKAILMVIAMVTPIFIGVQFDILQIGIHVCLGAIFASPSDMSGSFKLNVIGMTLSIVLAMSVTFIASIFNDAFWPLLPLMSFLIFGIAYFSVFGFRASLISFTGLFALVLSFSSLAEGELSPLTRALLIGLGGFWYLGLSCLQYLIFPKGPIEYNLSQTLKLTADYLEIRGQLFDAKNNRLELSKQLLQLQVDLTENHETLRELLIANRRRSGRSTFAAKRMLIFIQLVDMLELAMTHPVDYAKTDEYFKKNAEQLADFQLLLSLMSERIRIISFQTLHAKNIQKSKKIKKQLNKIEKEINLWAEQIESEYDSELLMITNLLNYQKNQANRIKKIEWILKEPSKTELKTAHNSEYKKFVTKQKYNWSIFVDNLNLRSTIFRHSLRISIMVTIGFIVGKLLGVANPHWIALTIIVIMRPNYGLTKTRFKQRTIGTLIGGIVAYLLIVLINNTTFYGIGSVVSFVIAFSMIQRNYRATATFITIHVLFIYALMEPNVLDYVQYRVVDTLIGAGLAASANLLLWPAWEIKSINKTLLESVKSNRKYLTIIAEIYNTKAPVSHDYKLSRKQAFLAMSDLSASFQRMAQEPKSKQKGINEVYQVVMLNHTFLAALASLSVYINNNLTTPASHRFNTITDKIIANLLTTEAILNNEIVDISKEVSAQEFFSSVFGDDILELATTTEGHSDLTLQDKIEEAHLITEQLRWLLEISERIPKELIHIYLD